MTTSNMTRKAVWTIAIGVLALAFAWPVEAQSTRPAATAAAPAVQTAKESAGVTSEQSITFGVDILDLTGDRPAKFYQGRSVPEGFTLPAIRWAAASADYGKYVQLFSRDLLQGDEQVTARAAAGALKVRFNWTEIPWAIGNGARSLHTGLGSSRLYAPADLRGFLQDPNKDGVVGSEADNAILPASVRDLVMRADSNSYGLDRQTGDFSLVFAPTANWNLDLAYRRENQDGVRAMGTGTYDRFTFPSTSGLGLDEYFFDRGTELLRPIAYSTTAFTVGTHARMKRAFGDVALEFVNFANDNLSLTYDNPLWLTDFTSARPPAGISRNWARGLSQGGRLALAPESDAWNVTATGGFTLPRSTRLTATVVSSHITQDTPFLPYSTNTALTGLVDVNRDGVVDSKDDATDVRTLPKASLGGDVQTTAFTLSFSTRPAKAVTINVRLPYYKYDTRHESILFPYRVDYGESAWANNIQSKPILSEEEDFTRRSWVIEGIVKPVEAVAFSVFGRNLHWDYGDREVKATDMTTFGAGVTLTPRPGLEAKLTYSNASREYDGTYTPKYSGEQQRLRMFDIANLDRNAFNLDVTLDPNEQVSFGAHFRYLNDEYPDSAFGLQQSKTQGGGFDINLHASERATVFAFFDMEDLDWAGHGDTKMGTFNVSGNDWFYSVADQTRSFGAGFDAAIVPDKYKLALNVTYVGGTVAQATRNPGTPTSALAAKGVDFPDQKSTLTSAELKLTRRLSKRVSLGVAYLFENFDLEDFAWDGMQPYGNDFLTVDNNLRYLFLDLRYGSYTAHLGRAFVKVTF